MNNLTPSITELQKDFSKPKFLGNNALVRDAWGRQKTITDISLFRGLWTYDVPVALWLEYHGTGLDISTMTEQQRTLNATSQDGMLTLTSGSTVGDIKTIRSKQHPRYQPNRGHLYSTAINIPNPTNNGFAEFGLFNKDNGVFFKVSGDGTDYKMEVVVRRDGSIVENTDITQLLPENFDVTKGHVYDIQMQWRGVGDFKFFIDLQEIFSYKFLGTLEHLSTSNPALPVAYSCGCITEEYLIQAGCVDVTSEGGSEKSLVYNSETTGDNLLNTETTGTAMLAVKIPTSINGKLFTRDTLFSKMTSFCKDEAIHSLWVGRVINMPHVEGINWHIGVYSLNEFIIGGAGSDLNDAFNLDKQAFYQVYSSRQEKDFAKMTETSSSLSDFILSPGDVLVATLKSDSASKGGVTLEFDVEI